MSVSPPMGSGEIRMIKIGDNIDFQPCGGTHVKNSSEIGEIEVSKVENKGKRNKRVIVNISLTSLAGVLHEAFRSFWLRYFDIYPYLGLLMDHQKLLESKMI